MKFDYQVNFNLQDCLKGLGLDERGRVQCAVDEAFLKEVEPYVPFDTGVLIDSGTQKVCYGIFIKILKIFIKNTN